MLLTGKYVPAGHVLAGASFFCGRGGWSGFHTRILYDATERLIQGLAAPDSRGRYLERNSGKLIPGVAALSNIAGPGI